MADARPVICATEDSEAARHAVRAATWLAGGLGAPLLLAHVFDPLGIGTLSREEMLRRRITDEDLEQSARVAARRLLDDTAGAVTGAELETKLEEGQPVPELRRLATERRATLLVAGAAARGGLDRILIGSVAGRLAAVAPCPLVVVPRGAALDEPGPVVSGYDGSAHSLRAARHAAALSARLGRELVLVHVTGDDGVRPGEDLARELHHAGVRGLGDDPGRPRLDLKVRLAVEAGDPVQILAAVAREESAALLATGTRGRNALSSALLGSVSAGLVRAAGRPVALVPRSAGERPHAA